jgi:thioredoxin reductase (NADPH)
MPSPIQTEALIIGAGPVGLFQVFELGLLGIRSHVVDALPAVGGQCVELYPDKPIYDIPAVPVCSGQELTDNLMAQLRPFDPTFHMGQRVMKVDKRGDRDFVVETHTGQIFHAGCVLLAAGMGSFVPKRIGLKTIHKHEGVNLAYKVMDPTRYHGKEVVILGGGDSALDWALALADKASVVLVHRRDTFRAQPASVEKMRTLCDNLQMQCMVGTVAGIVETDGRLTGLKIHGPDHVVRALELDALLCFWGLSPKLGAIADWGLDLAGKRVRVDTEKFQTNIEGFYAVGDINTYPGKKKLILSGFHEAALAAFAAKAYLYPDEKVFLEYTTTSPKLHQRLGVEDPYKDDLS